MSNEQDPIIHAKFTRGRNRVRSKARPSDRVQDMLDNLEFSSGSQPLTQDQADALARDPYKRSKWTQGKRR